MATLRVKQAFAVPQGGILRVLRPGDLVDSEDSVVGGRESLFEPVETAVVRDHNRIEQATAAPGEKRTRTRGRKRAAKKAAPASGEQATAAPGDDSTEE